MFDVADSDLIRDDWLFRHLKLIKNLNFFYKQYCVVFLSAMFFEIERLPMSKKKIIILIFEIGVDVSKTPLFPSSGQKRDIKS